MAADFHKLHFLLIPLLSPSHIIPLSDFGLLLARRGVRVSIITTPVNAARCQESVDLAIQAGLAIQMITLEFPGKAAGLPPGCENMDLLTSMDESMEFFTASEMLQAPLEKAMEQLDPKPNCIISTTALPWTHQVAKKFKIPRYVFATVSCFTQLCSYIVSQAENQETGVLDIEKFVVPGIPHKVEISRAQLPDSMKKLSTTFQRLSDQMTKAGMAARGTLVNTFQELEPWYLEGYQKVRQKIWSIGPMSLSNKKVSDRSYRGNQAAIDEKYCVSWLDARETGSVIYACFGSLSHISAAQVVEIGLGLEASNCPFVWVIRIMDCSPEVEKWLGDEKFEQRVEGRGLVIRGWAPQVLILSHPSTGGFLTHCGWNSTLEGICAGVPMVTWPMFAEQFYNEKFIVDVVEIGVRIGVEQRGEFVTWDRVQKSIQELMREGNERKERVKRAQKLKEKAGEALEEKGSSYLNISLLIEDVMDQSVMN